MIVLEDAIQGIVDQLPEIDGFPINFHWGGQDELNRYIALKKMPYPLIWGIPQKETIDRDGKFLNTNAVFFLATRENQTDRLNDVRLNESFKKVLFPLLENLRYGFLKSNRINFTRDDDEFLKLPNFSESGENKTIDYWDAIEYRCSLRVSDNCEKQILKFRKI